MWTHYVLRGCSPYKHMNKDPHQKEHFRTTSFYLAVFLFAKGIELLNIDKITDPRRSAFIFNDSPERMTLTESFNFGRENNSEVMVDSRKLIQSIKILKEKLYQDNF